MTEPRPQPNPEDIRLAVQISHQAVPGDPETHVILHLATPGIQLAADLGNAAVTRKFADALYNGLNDAARDAQRKDSGILLPGETP